MTLLPIGRHRAWRRMDMSVDGWMASDADDAWSLMMRGVAAFHHKHDFAGNNGHDMGYRIALTVEELGELAAAITKAKPLSLIHI